MIKNKLKSQKLAPNTPLPAKKNFAVRNKNAGNAFELQSIKALRLVGFEHLVSSRAENPRFDGLKIDLCNKDMHINGRFPYNIQCKNVATNEGKGIEYPKILESMPKGEEINVIFHNQTVKRGERFITRGQYAILSMADMITMMSKLDKLQKGFKLLQDNFDYIPLEEQPLIQAELEALGL